MTIQPLSLTIDLETKKVLKAALIANRHLTELKGSGKSIPNQTILINTLSIQEAKDSSEVEQIITTHNENFQASVINEEEE